MLHAAAFQVRASSLSLCLPFQPSSLKCWHLLTLSQGVAGSDSLAPGCHPQPMFNQLWFQGSVPNKSSMPSLLTPATDQCPVVVLLQGGINFTTTVKDPKLDLDAVKSVCAEYRIHNADVHVKVGYMHLGYKG